ncbi:DUF3291 domain-containing protein [Peterkaempfera bronchialis]|uniref:DUF3291 domain-containing protein n=1 Tax=Peterkaempfera bronchialis TaxID=2126346 RepID=UPI003C2BEE98
MPTLPWRAAAAAPAPDGSEAVVFASRLGLGSAHHVPVFLWAALSIRRQVLAADGALGVSLVAEPFARTFWTLSAWRDHATLDAFVGQRPHVDTMRRFRGRLDSPVFISWTTPAGDLPVDWAEARRRIAEAEDPTGG